MSDAIDFVLIHGWEPTGRRVRLIESVEVMTERARKLMVRHRQVTEDEVPPPEDDPKIAAALSELAGRTMSDSEIVYDISRFLKASGWSKDDCFGLACNIAFANLEEADKYDYLAMY